MSTPAGAAAPSAAPSTQSAPSSAPSSPQGSGSSSAPSTLSTPSSSSASGNLPAGQGTGAATGVSTPAEKAAAEIRKLKLKVGGKEVEYEEGEVIRRAQLAEGADQKFKEASEMRKQAQQIIEALRSDPMSVLGHPELGINMRELAENYLAGELQREMMDPKDREIEELRSYKQKQLDAQKQAEANTQSQAQRQAETQLMQRAQQQYDTDITQALNSSNLPKSPYTVKRVAEVLASALEKGYELDIPTAVDMVRERYSQDIQAMVGALDGDSLIKMLGDGVVGKLRKHDLARIKAKLADPSVASKPQAVNQEREPTKSKEFLRPDEWKKQIRKDAGF